MSFDPTDAIEADVYLTRHQEAKPSGGKKPSGPFKMLDAANRIVEHAAAGPGITNPFLLGMGTANRAPSGLLPVIGATVGSLASPVLGTGAGAFLGTGAKRIREAQQGKPLAGAGAEALMAGATGAVTGLAGKFLSKAPAVMGGARTLFSGNRQIALAEKARGELAGVVRGAGPAFEKELTNLPGTVDISRIIDSIDLQNPAIRRGIQQAAKLGDTTLEEFLTNPGAAAQATPLQAQKVMNTLRQSSGGQRVLGMSRQPFGTTGRGQEVLNKASGEELDLLDSANDIKQTLMDAYPDQFPDIGGKFAKTQQAFRLLKPRFKEGALVENIKKGFRDPEIAKKIQETLTPETVKELMAVPAARRLLQVLAGGALLVGGGGYGLKRLESAVAYRQ